MNKSIAKVLNALGFNVQITRYFVVFYIGKVNNGKDVVGTATGKTSGTFLSEDETVNTIKNSTSGISVVIITNIIELTKSDYEVWKS